MDVYFKNVDPTIMAQIMADPPPSRCGDGPEDTWCEPTELVFEQVGNQLMLHIFHQDGCPNAEREPRLTLTNPAQLN